MEAPHTTAAPAAPAPAPAATRTNRLTRVVYAILAIIGTGIGLLRLVDTFTLPSCTSETARKTIVEIGKEKGVAISDLTDIRSREDAGSDVQCSATMALEDSKKYAIDYRAFWEGWSAKIKIDKVEPL
jgi:hypothetical protein